MQRLKTDTVRALDKVQLAVIHNVVDSMSDCISRGHMFKSQLGHNIHITLGINDEITYLISLPVFNYWQKYCTKYGKCPKILNTLFHTFVDKIMLFMWLFPKILSGMANSVDSDQTAPSGAVWSWSALFACAILSSTLVYKFLGHLPYWLTVLRINPAKERCE